MIGIIKAIVSLACAILHYGLYASYKIGHLLVLAIGFFQKLFAKFMYLLLEVFGALFESFTTFCQDIVQDFQNILRTLSSIDILTYLGVVRNIIQSVVSIIITLSEIVVKFVLSVVITIQTVLLSPKYVLVYLLKSMWSIVSCIKESFNDLNSFFKGSVEAVSQTFRDLVIIAISFWTTLPRVIYDFLTDIPVESILGITISCCLIYLFARFYVIVFSFLYRQLKRLFFNMRRRYIELRMSFPRRIVPERAVYRRPVLPTRRPHIRTERYSVNSAKNEGNDRYCVICQEQVKCILLLPCRHLCMCNECIDTLQTYHYTCPICRSNIESTMQIFV